MTGQKLLVADDSVTIRKVIDLTFSDEGMQVVTVGNGEDAIQKLEEFTPDIVLADVLMPGPDGYRLCEFIKESERFRQIPVMLLVGSFEPFDEAEARRVGADDFLTKPFQSIKQLVSRVGSLLGGKPAEAQPMSSQFATLGLSVTSDEAPTAPLVNPSVLQAESEAPTPAGDQSESSIELQTADTKELHPEMLHEPDEDIAAARHEAEPSETETMQTITETRPESIDLSDALLELDDLDGVLVEAELDEVILDIDDESPIGFTMPAVSAPLVAEAGAAVATLPATTTEHKTELETTLTEAPVADWMLSSSPDFSDDISETAEQSIGEVETSSTQSAAPELSAAAIEAIAQRVIEKLSEKVVREIAWEVVPELSELLIKQRLEDQHR
jgi:CheY-like chemotaxis protein